MKSLDIDRIAFIGRTFEEYSSFFDLDGDILGKGPVLDCAAGPSSFTAEANLRGYNVRACDIFYDLEPFELFKKGNHDIAYVFRQFGEVAENYVWDFYGGRNELEACRKLALGRFIRDFTRFRRKGRYIQAALPGLPYGDNEFALVLSSHFLFLYGDRMDTDFHTASLVELARVCCGEIRIYPLTGLDSEPYPFLDEVRSSLGSSGFYSEVHRVPFEFQKGSVHMLTIYINNEEQPGGTK